ncbi:hypothetical protein B0H14DRAFT_3868458 [Mycena olivaceomarginata]|nr:hypothetical protein B0H14DRAFT_3868458 [Mycena olivaceomarginata]
MAKGKPGGQTTPALNTASAAFTFPTGLDDHFRSPSDAPDNHVSAYERASLYAAGHPDTYTVSLWQRALDIGFMAGRYLAMEATQKEGERIGFEKGRVEGLSEGKRVGFVAGREFGEKQAAKLSKTPTSDRVFVDVGTDSPAAELSPSPHPSPTSFDTSVQTDAPLIVTSAATRTPFVWADDDYAPNSTSIPPPMPRDFSALRSNSNATAPFASLQFRAHRKHKPVRAPRNSASHTTSRRQHYAPAPVYRLTATALTPKPTRVPLSALDWDHDPRLSDLNRVLRSLGWRREGGGVV